VKARGRLEGVGNVVRFNWPMYAAAAGASCLLGAAAASRAPRSLRMLAALGSAGAAAFSLGSLAASHWIYDRSELYSWRWLDRVVTRAPRRVLNVHAGFDESSEVLAMRFSGAELVTCDFYDAERNTEPSIARARRRYPPRAGTRPATCEHLPVEDGWADLLVGFFAIHEIRSARDRRAFFVEARRCCAPGARFVLVEHLRDAANFAAFGPGFLHFFSRRTWLAAAEGPFRLTAEFSITPFVRVFAFEAT
jgi:SAM-dependent methyltransferase